MPPQKKNYARGSQRGGEKAKPHGKNTSRRPRRLNPAEQKALYDEIARGPILANASEAYRRRAEVILDLWYDAHWVHPNYLVRWR